MGSILGILVVWKMAGVKTGHPVVNILRLSEVKKKVVQGPSLDLCLAPLTRLPYSINV